MSMRILIVDPDWHFVGQAREYLESRGDFVACEQKPDGTLARVVRWRPDVVMISAELSEVWGGYMLRNLGKVNPAPAVILTAGLDRFDKAWQAWQRGGHEVLFKPVLHPSELHVTIISALGNALCPRNRQGVPQPAAVPA